jgi:hypothetical protein
MLCSENKCANINKSVKLSVWCTVAASAGRPIGWASDGLRVMGFQHTVLRLHFAEEHVDFGRAPDTALPPLRAITESDQDIAAPEEIWRVSADPYIENHPGWAMINAKHEELSLRVFSTSNDDRIDSYALVEEGRGVLVWLLGYLRIYRKPIERLRLGGGQVFAPRLGPSECRERARELLAWLTQEARGRPIFLHGLPLDSPLCELLHSGHHRFWVLRQGRRQAHFSLDLSDSMATFYAGLSYKTRRTLRYSVRKLEKEFQGRVALKSFSNQNEIAGFLDDAMMISQKTHQYRLLHLGLRNREKLSARFGEMSKHGWWRGYILYCNEEPVAFAWGYRLAHVFYYWDVGYDPQWRERSVGTVALVLLIEHLITSEDPPRRLDLLYGELDYKKRIANHSRYDESVYLFHRNFRMFFLFSSLWLVNTLTEKAGNILDRYNFRSRVIRLLRRRATDN